MLVAVQFINSFRRLQVEWKLFKGILPTIHYLYDKSWLKRQTIFANLQMRTTHIRETHTFAFTTE